jgi:hypothetical protein
MPGSGGKKWTMAAFCRVIGDMNSNSCGRFMKARGTMGGAESAIYRYVATSGGREGRS